MRPPIGQPEHTLNAAIGPNSQGNVLNAIQTDAAINPGEASHSLLDATVRDAAN